jgi:hypothetical protein
VVCHLHAAFQIGSDDCFGRSFQYCLKKAFLTLDLPYVLLYLLGHVVEGPDHLSQLVLALHRDGGIIAGGKSYRRVAGFGEGTCDPARQEQTRAAGEEHACHYGSDYSVAQVGERLV